MDRITRKELKTDKFREEVAHTVEYVEMHKRQVVRYAAAAAAIIVALAAYSYYNRQQRALRQTGLHAAMEIQNTQIGPPSGNEMIPTFPNVEERSKAAGKAFSDILKKYSGTQEAQISQYYLGILAADQGKLAEAEKDFKQAAESGDRNYASLALFSLATVEKSLGKSAEAETLLRGLIEKPTVFVSQEQATIALARMLAGTRPNEARKLLEPLRTGRSAVSRTALTTLAEFPPQ